ncbi:PREDICTED: DC-STAMP domain-containing protein 2-like [Branchiostoma belcheri]|uniref:DC-STAMP domain-containing protein 2-like n=1 Tax=Branchiostoma belcheri TaxID=7741 RepID=A0A6P5AS29_BRABE|nr:PREDICTED: DC-STAMP domain-containing protein 2-like [Branchiostoma belcheri]
MSAVLKAIGKACFKCFGKCCRKCCQKLGKKCAKQCAKCCRKQCQKCIKRRAKKYAKTKAQEMMEKHGEVKASAHIERVKLLAKQYHPMGKWDERCSCTICIKCVEKLCCCRTELTESSNPVRRCCIPGTRENSIAKIFLGFLSGLLLTVILYYLMIHHMNYAKRSADVAGCVLGVILTVGMAGSAKFRCTILLMLPNFFSSRGRSVAMAYAMVLVMSGPYVNLQHNIEVGSRSMSCGAALAANQSEALADLIMSPVSHIIDAVEAVIQQLKEAAEKAKKGFIAVRDAMVAVGKAIKKAAEWLGNLGKVCNKKLGKPRDICINELKKAYKDCRSRGLTFLCEVVNVGELCNIADAAVKVMENLEHQFYFDVDIFHNYTLIKDVSKSGKEIREEIMQEIKGRTETFRKMIRAVSNVMVITFLVLYIKAASYRRKYMTKDRFDNLYITEEFKAMDKKRNDMWKETVLPLDYRDYYRYIHPAGFRLCKAEKSKLWRGLIFWAINVIYGGFIMGMDWAQWWLLIMVKLNADMEIDANPPARIGMQIKGDGMLADMFRVLVSSFDPLAEEDFTFDTTKCLPHPTFPDLSVYKKIGFIYGACLFTVIFEAYGLRLRRATCASYFPERERERVVWLYNHMLKRRGGLVATLRKWGMRKAIEQMAEEAGQEVSFGPEREVYDSNVLDRCASSFPCVERLLKMCGWKGKKFCISCAKPGEQEDKKKFKHCENAGCKGIFCLDCWIQINNTCTLCMRPVDYSDVAYVSEERDSSDEEELRKVRRAKKRRGSDAALRTRRLMKEQRETEKQDEEEAKLAKTVPEEQSLVSSSEDSEDESGDSDDVDTDDLDMDYQYTTAESDSDSEENDATRVRSNIELVTYQDVTCAVEHSDWNYIGQDQAYQYDHLTDIRIDRQ